MLSLNLPQEEGTATKPILHVMKLKQRWVWNPDAKPKPLTVGSAASKKVCNLSPVHHPALTRCGITGGPLREDTPGPCSSHPLPVSSEQRQGSLQASFSKTFCSPQPKAGLGSWANPLMQTHTSNFVACPGVKVRPRQPAGHLENGQSSSCGWRTQWQRGHRLGTCSLGESRPCGGKRNSLLLCLSLGMVVAEVDGQGFAFCFLT